MFFLKFFTMALIFVVVGAQAGLAQGPGFPNLSCLGLLSDRILRRYVAVNDAGTLVPERSELA